LAEDYELLSFDFSEELSTERNISEFGINFHQQDRIKMTSIVELKPQS